MPKTEISDHPGSPAGNGSVTASLKRRWLLNAGLLLLIGALAGILAHRSEQKKLVAPPPLTTLSADSVAHIRIEQQGQAPIVLEKTGSDWSITAPLPARANQFNVENLMRVLSAPGATRIPAVATDLAKFGLDKPQSRVWFENYAIAFGILNPLNDQVYVLYKNEVVLIPAYYLASATYPYNNFIDSRLFGENRKFTSVKLPTFTLTLNDGVWQRQPPDKQLTSDQINDFASEWQNARALSVDKYSGKPALSEIEITSTQNSKNEKLRLDILAYKPDFVLHRQDENLEYHFTEETGKHLLNLPSKD
ncbi:MAG: DUF4340 domain-containing protein [Sulfuricaulis sp.]